MTLRKTYSTASRQIFPRTTCDDSDAFGRWFNVLHAKHIYQAFGRYLSPAALVDMLSQGLILNHSRRSLTSGFGWTVPLFELVA